MKMVEGNVPSNDCQGSNSLKVIDDNDVLSLKSNEITDGMRYWYPSRSIEGIVTAEFKAFLMEVDEHIQVGPRVDMRLDQGEIAKAKKPFIPVPPNRNAISDIHLHWNLAAALDGTTTVWSFGANVKSSKTGTIDILTASTFMAGPINNYTRHLLSKTQRLKTSEYTGLDVSEHLTLKKWQEFQVTFSRTWHHFSRIDKIPTNFLLYCDILRSNS
jgi:hypothetical protein